MNTSSAETLAAAAPCLAAGQLAQAEQKYAFILSTEPGHADALHGLAMVARARGNHVQAVEYLSRAVASPGATPVHWNNLGVLHMAVGNAASAQAAFEQAVLLKPDYAEAISNLGVVLLERGEVEPA